jgi:methionyl-tRNA formyltransferase
MALKLIFMGTPDFAVPTLAALIEAGHEIVCVYSQPPRPAGRGQSERLTPVHAFAAEHRIDVRTPVSLKDGAEQQAFAALGADAAIVVAYGLILPQAILDAPRLGCLNLHGSLLPRWRGAAPLQRAIMAGDSESGVCIMQMDAGLDTGDVLATRVVPLTATATAGELHDQLAEDGAPLMVETLAQLAAGELTAEPQPADGVTYAAKIDKSEARIDWRLAAAEIDCLIRGLSPFPGAWFSYAGERIKVLNATVVDQKGDAGKSLDRELTIACGEGALRLETVQRGGRKPMSAGDLLRGFPIPMGADLLADAGQDG